MFSYVSCIFSDPYDGPTNPSQVIKVTQALLDAGCYEVSLGDTLGVGTPFDVENLLNKMFKTITADRLAGHFHDTYGQAIANVVKALDMGIRTFDSSVAGLGGCPFAKGARGNLSTEDLVYTLEKMGIQTGVNLDELVSTGAWISQQLQLPNGSRAGSALFAKSKASTPVEIPSTKSTRPWTTLKSAGDYRLSRRGANVNICLTRPQNGNALSLPMIRSFIALFKRLSADESVFRIILSAEGKYFCTGMDLKGPGTAKERFDGLSELYHVIDTCPKTTIAAISGPCLGGGVGLAFVCDIRLLAPTVTFKLSEVRLGLCPATISKYVVREWGFALARAAMLTAREVTASELAIANIVHKVSTSKEALLLDLDDFLDEMRFVAPHASRLSKGLVTSAWLDAGGMEQEQVIARSFSEMMAKGTESEHAIKEFRKGVKGVDWELLSTTAVRPKL
jgi:hydroxymethylglutaryl-CoA lyase